MRRAPTNVRPGVVSIERRRLLAAALALAPGARAHAFGAAAEPLAASTPPTGWSADRLAAVQAFVERIGSTAAMVVQHGEVVAAWGDVTRRSNLHSARKSLLNALIGIAVEQGRIDLDASLAQLGIDDLPPALTAQEKQATVRQLLEARSGIYHAAAYETRSMQAAKPARGSHAPGSFWYYNNWDFNTLGAIYEQATGEKIFEAFAARIAQPLGMQDYRASDGHDVFEAGSRFPAYVFEMSARDLARFARLYLHRGRWGDAQVVPQAWVEASTRPYSATPSGGYGWLWWTADAPAGDWPQIAFPPGCFWAEGHLGQYAVVLPALDLVVVNLVDERQTRRSVGKRQMAELVRRVVDAATGAAPPSSRSTP